MSWQEFENGAAKLANLGRELLHGKIAFLATSRKDGSPRLHPVRPFIGKDHLFLFIHEKSPKKQDLMRDGRFALHSSVFQLNGPSTEFMIAGSAKLNECQEIRETAFRAVGSNLPDEQFLFVLSVDKVLVTEYDKDRNPVRRRWRAESSER